PEDRGAIDTLLKTTEEWKTGTDPQRALRRKSGKKLTVEITTSAVAFEGVSSVFCSVRDITARVKAEREAADYRSQLEKVNAGLEERVRQRTEELAKAMDRLQLQKKAVDDVMNNIQQGILTINPSLEIN